MATAQKTERMDVNDKLKRDMARAICRHDFPKKTRGTAERILPTLPKKVSAVSFSEETKDILRRMDEAVTPCSTTMFEESTKDFEKTNIGAKQFLS